MTDRKSALEDFAKAASRIVTLGYADLPEESQAWVQDKIDNHGGRLLVRTEIIPELRIEVGVFIPGVDEKDQYAHLFSVDTEELPENLH